MLAAPLHRYIRQRHARPQLRVIGLYGGLALALAVLALGWLLDPALPPAWRVGAVAALMASWWISEALPLPATALVPLVAFPLLGVADIAETAAPYAHPVVYLFLGGFLLAMAIQRHGLHKRMALSILRLVGTRPDRLVAGFLGATAFLSAWVSNTATATMMLPIALSVVRMMEGAFGAAPAPGRNPNGRSLADNIGTALLLSVAIGASVGGIATLIGTPPNAIMAGVMQQKFGIEVSFVQWMAVGVPFALVLLAISWWVLTVWAFPVGRQEVPQAAEVLARDHAALGGMSRAEWLVAIIAGATGIALVLRPVLSGLLPDWMALSDAGIAIFGAILMFLIPADREHRTFLLDWGATKELPWGVLVLFGGGLSLGAMMGSSGLAAGIADQLAALQVLPLFVITMLVALIVMVVGHLASHTATAAAFLPLIGALAVSIGEAPLTLIVPATLAASCTFMLPVGTPPNAIVYASGLVDIRHMVRAGAVLNLIALALIALTVPLLPLIGF